jgi:hypothetical protein
MNRSGLLLGAWIMALPTLAMAGPRPWLAAGLGGSTYSMDDVNEDVGGINTLLAGSGLKMDEITKGLTFGASGGVDLGNGFGLGIGYDRLTASTDVGDFSGGIEYHMPANLFRALGRYSFANTGKSRGFLEAALGRVTSAGEVRLTVAGVGSQVGKLEGSGLAFEAGGGGEIWAGPQVAIVGGVGYRHASVRDVKLDGSPVYNASGDGYSIDYSGVFLRAGLLFALVP